MKQVPLKATFSFDMAKHKSGAFTASIKAGGFDGTLINSFAEPMGLMKIERGRLLGTEATMQGDQWKSSGEVFIPYEDLKLNLMEKEAGQKKLDKKDVTSFAANLLVIKNNNPKEGKKSRREATEFTRIPEGGFLCWYGKRCWLALCAPWAHPIKLRIKQWRVQRRTNR